MERISSFADKVRTLIQLYMHLHQFIFYCALKGFVILFMLYQFQDALLIFLMWCSILSSLLWVFYCLDEVHAEDLRLRAELTDRLASSEKVAKDWANSGITEMNSGVCMKIELKSETLQAVQYKAKYEYEMSLSSEYRNQCAEEAFVSREP
jgi:hypothetical protein